MTLCREIRQWYLHFDAYILKLDTVDDRIEVTVILVNRVLDKRKCNILENRTAYKAERHMGPLSPKKLKDMY
jgi:hypothetical protein